MKLLPVIFLMIFSVMISKTSISQGWEIELMAGASGYSGDLSQKSIPLKTLGPAVGINIKHPVINNFLVVRGGFTYGKVSANDQDNSDPVIKNRNLNFKTDILEFHMGLELNLLDSREFTGYPYVFGGVGIFHFNPYTFDSDNNKTFLWSLGTEGQGLVQYPDKTQYSLTQICIPFGGGWKHSVNEKLDIVYELGGRLLFTDHLDDVSTTYADPQVLALARGPRALELANRQLQSPTTVLGRQRGNPEKNDWYFISGFKLLYRIGG